MSLYKWSQTPSANASADPTINLAEGQAPSSVNDSARALMAAVAKYRDDNAGTLQTAGSSTAYTLATNQVFDTAAHMNGEELSFYIHATNGASPTLNVDGLGAFPLVTDAAASPIPAGTLISGSNYTACFALSANQFRLRGFYVNPYNIPLGGMMDYIGSTVPSSNFVFPIGQAISRTTYATLFALIGTAYGGGDGSTTFNVPDLTGRVTAMRETVADGSRRLNTTHFGDSTVLGAAGGIQSKNLSIANINPFTPTVASATVNLSGGVALAPLRNWSTGGGGTPVPTQLSNGSNLGADQGTLSVPLSGTVNASIAMSALGSGTAHAIVQPTMIVNKILRII